MMTFALRLAVFATTIVLGCAADDSEERPASAPGATSTRATSNRATHDPGIRDSAAGSVATPRKVVVHGIDLTGVGYDKGRSDAPMVVVEFSDFGCPYCARHAQQTFPAIEREFIATGKVFYKYVPFVMGMFPNGGQAARAAECAADQGKFWAMHDTLFTRQSEWKKSLSPFPVITRYAESIGLDATSFRACYVGHVSHHPRTVKANERADRLGVRVTPSFVVDGRAVEGALPLPQFRELLTGLAERK